MYILSNVIFYVICIMQVFSQLVVNSVWKRYVINKMDDFFIVCIFVNMC